MAQLRFPLNDKNEAPSPFILFTPIKATFRTGGELFTAEQLIDPPIMQDSDYDFGTEDDEYFLNQAEANKTILQKTAVSVDGEDSIALYMPRGVQFADQINYNNIQNPLLVNVMQGIKDSFDNGSVSTPSVADTTAYLARSSIGGEFLSGLRRRILQDSQQILNPREFALFDAPQMRSFTLSFKFIPDSAAESNVIAEIIKKFRQNAYPTFNNDTQSIYKFPSAFIIRYEGIKEGHMIKFPEVVLTNVNVQYNNNSMSYHNAGDGFSPVEIDMTLTFNELLPQSSTDIQAGY